MATLISSTAGAALTTGRPRLRLPLSATITGLVAHLTVIVPSGVSQILIRGRAGIGGLYSVTPSTTEVIELTRDEPGLSEHPHVTISVEAPGYRSTPIKLRFVRDVGQVGIPVTLTTAGTMSAGTASGTALTYTAYVWAGDVSELQDTIWTSATEGGTYADTGERWTSIAYTTGVWFKRRARAFGPTVANPLINDWTAWQETTPRQITARPAARTLVAGVDFEIDRTVYRPTTQSTWRTPIVEALSPIIGQIGDFQATAADVSNPSPTWSNLLPRPGEANRYDMFDPAHPVTDPAADAGLFNEASGTGRASRFSVRWRADALQPWSARSIGINVPAVIVPGGFNYVVSNRTELVAAMTAATSGQTIGMNPGNYEGTIDFRNRNKGNPGITILPVNPANRPVILNGTVDVEGSTGITFDGLIIRMTVKDKNATYYGTGPYLYPANNSQGGFNGTNIEGSTRVTFRNCTFEGQHIAINGAFTTNFTVDRCHITGCGMDSIRLYNTNDGFILRHTLFDAPNVDLKRATADNADGAARHPDFLQFANSQAMNYPGCSNFLIENNRFYGSYGYHQAIFMYNEKCSRGDGTVAANGHNNGIVRGNYIESRHVHGITLSATGNVLVEGNLIRSKPPSTTANDLGAVNPPDITITGTLSDAQPTGIVRNNVMPTRTSHGDNDLRRLASTSSQALLTRTGNVRSNTATPPGWVMPLVGPYAF